MASWTWRIQAGPAPEVVLRLAPVSATATSDCDKDLQRRSTVSVLPTRYVLSHAIFICDIALKAHMMGTYVILSPRYQAGSS